MEALCERVLALVPPEELQTASNLVLQEEFLAVDEAANDVLSAFAKLEEVRSAVSKLEQDCASGRGSCSSLLATIESTIAVQRQLEKRLRKIAANASVNVTLDERKRKRKHEDDNQHFKKSSIGSTDSVAATQNGEGPKSEAQVEASDHPLLQLETKDLSPTPRVSESKRSLHARNEVDATTRRRKMEVKPPRYYMDRVKEVDALPPKERILCIPYLLRELTVSLAEDNSYGQRFRFTSYLKDMLRWITQTSGQREQLDMFLDFTESVKSFAAKLPDSAQTVGFVRLTVQLTDVVHGKPGGVSKSRPRRPRRS
ncbi:hypothetical protein PC116_g21903 [Phytophthora cactorum]|uniref:Uncharacterized protein n=1 Tax=Phytophthora cactorum TaxID=29920 RepID=A0A8T1G2C1_9STRA|nr:hypothetical protein Pcac1_g27651 [Phytophthora cactorum]KAG2806353.1 hypothetical protein PC112_g17873 [Phytophthora cactorum]KAG2808013.1 hypothetical protein PC111_g16672 [Phytophthora cactorum]KAG2865631.1 hypothetical protein PC113_g3503 [Phytophthora cactorum]KAG2912010.1 hypothetical protein PC117_g19009 [Phytophthora cactorum]